MNIKATLTLIMVINGFISCLGRAALRRTPKVYNALITTDENLTSSRAYPVIQPTIHETGIAHYPFAHYNGYSYYSPPLVHLGQPISPGLVHREQVPYPLPQAQFPPPLMPHLPPHLRVHQGFQGYPPTTTTTVHQNEQGIITVNENAQENSENTELAPTEQQQPVVPPKDIPAQPHNPKYMPIEETAPQQIPNDKLPIELNEYGLPPSLIPLHQYPALHNGNPHPPHQQIPVNLPPYAFTQYPILPGYYDPITGFREQYLPPYDYTGSSQQTYALAAAAAAAGAAKKGYASKSSETPKVTPQQEEANLNSNSNAVGSASESASESESESPKSELETKMENVGENVVPDFESIKNGSENKNSEVPDVPPPPIPSGAKTKSSQ